MIPQVEQIPYTDETRPAAETVHFIREHNRRRLAQINRSDDERETRLMLERALRTIRPGQGA